MNLRHGCVLHWEVRHKITTHYKATSTQTAQGNLSPCRKTFNLLTDTNSLLPCQVTFTGPRDEDKDILLLNLPTASVQRVSKLKNNISSIISLAPSSDLVSFKTPKNHVSAISEVHSIVICNLSGQHPSLARHGTRDLIHSPWF